MPDDPHADPGLRVRGQAGADQGIQVLVHREELAHEGLRILRQPGEKARRIIRCVGGKSRPDLTLRTAGQPGSDHGGQ